MTSELLGLGLLDKADVQNETQTNLHTKIFHARNIAPYGTRHHDYGILTEPMQANMVSQ
jgi:Xaa-Pro aminopeptidase